MSIPFTQFLLPGGTKVTVEIERPPEVENLARFLIMSGYHFEIEVLTTDAVNMDVSNDDSVIACEICDNGPECLEAVDRMIKNAVNHLQKGVNILTV